MKTYRTIENKQDLITRLNRIEGQVRGIKGMVEKDIYCDDVLTQISAVQSALKSVSKLILERHMKSCIVKRIKNDEIEVIDEVIKTLGKLL